MTECPVERDYFKMEMNHLPVLSNFRGYDMLVFKGGNTKIKFYIRGIFEPKQLVLCILSFALGDLFQVPYYSFRGVVRLSKSFLPANNIHGLFSTSQTLNVLSIYLHLP